MLVLSVAPSSEPCCQLRHAASTSLFWRTPPVLRRPAIARRHARSGRPPRAWQNERARARTAARTRGGWSSSGIVVRRELAAPARDRHSRVNSPTETLACLSISSAHKRFPAFFCAAPDFLPPPPKKNSGALSSANPDATTYRNTNAATTKNTNAYTQKHQCHDHKTTNAATTKTPMPRPQKHQCLPKKKQWRWCF
eukprot:COSAG02_NODE_11421_length_1727_cov_6.401720_2_plen_196_part_00